MAVIDPDVSVIALLMDQALADAATIKAQQSLIFGLTAALRASQQLQLGLADLLDQALASDG